jgi:hypothetical protein
LEKGPYLVAGLDVQQWSGADEMPYMPKNFVNGSRLIRPIRLLVAIARFFREAERGETLCGFTCFKNNQTQFKWGELVLYGGSLLKIEIKESNSLGEQTRKRITGSGGLAEVGLIHRGIGKVGDRETATNGGTA